MKLAAFFISSLLVGQVPTSLNFGSPAVSAPIPSATAVGATGFTNTFYWVVARTPGGYSSPGAAIATNTVGSANFSVSNYVVISWPAISGATGYDVIRSDSPSYPASTSCASCAVSLNQAGTSFSDQGGATSVYSGGAQSVATQAIFTLDNVTVATPQINVQILNSRQNVTFALPSTGVGTVTSVGMTVPGALLSVSGSPITTSGTLAVSLVTQSANCVFAGPTSGGAATPTCRALVSADLPAGVGTVTSVGLSLPGIFTVSGSPVTTTGTLTGTLATQTANTIWAGPTTGAAAAPTFRALVLADLPTGTITGSLAAGQVCYGSATNTCAGTNNLFWDSINNRHGINTATPVTELQVSSTSTSSPRGIMSAQYNTGTDGARFHGRKARGTEALPTTVVTGDNLTRWVGSGYDGSNYLEDASIIFGTEGTIAATRIPTNIQFLTATDASPSVLTEAMRINSAQNVGIGTGSAITAGFQVSKNGALSSGNGPAIKGDGTWITGGSATTTKPYLLIEPSGTTSTGWSTSGTGIGVNAASGFAGNLLDLQVAGSSKFKVDGSGNSTSGGYVLSSDFLGIAGGNGRLYSSGSGIIELANASHSDFNRLQFGGTTSSFPALKRSSAGIQVRLADDSDYALLTAGELRVTSDIGFVRTAASSLRVSDGSSGVSAIQFGIPKFSGTNSTGAGAALLGSNSPASTLTEPYTWITVTTSDGSTGYIPVWK